MSAETKQVSDNKTVAWALEQARTRYDAYIALTAPHLMISPRHRQLCKLLDDVISFKKRRVIISCPPRFGKSEFSVRRFIPYALGRDPTMPFILTGHTAELVQNFSKMAQMNMREEVYRAIFPKTEIDPYSQAVGNWRTTAGGQVLSFGIQAGITGHGCKIMIIDDPLKNREEADSPNITEKIWETYQNTLYTRLDPLENAIVLIATRQSPNDLIGKLLASDAGGEWEIFSFPICDDDGHSIFPERFSDEWIAKLKNTINAREFQSQYLCRPYIKTDHSIDRKTWNWIARAKVPTGVRWCYGIDLATTTKTQSDHTSVCHYGKDAAGNYYIDGGIYGKWSWGEAKQVILQYIRQNPAPVGFEDVSGYKTAAEELRQALAGTCPVFGSAAQSDKMSKAWGWISLQMAGKLFLVENQGAQKWYNELFYEAESFGSRAVKDDVIDSVSLAHEMSKRFGGSIKSGFV